MPQSSAPRPFDHRLAPREFDPWFDEMGTGGVTRTLSPGLCAGPVQASMGRVGTTGGRDNETLHCVGRSGPRRWRLAATALAGPTTGAAPRTNAMHQERHHHPTPLGLPTFISQTMYTNAERPVPLLRSSRRLTRMRVLSSSASLVCMLALAGCVSSGVADCASGFTIEPARAGDRATYAMEGYPYFLGVGFPSYDWKLVDARADTRSTVNFPEGSRLSVALDSPTLHLRHDGTEGHGMRARYEFYRADLNVSLWALDEWIDASSGRLQAITHRAIGPNERAPEYDPNAMEHWTLFAYEDAPAMFALGVLRAAELSEPGRVTVRGPTPVPTTANATGYLSWEEATFRSGVHGCEIVLRMRWLDPLLAAQPSPAVQTIDLVLQEGTPFPVSYSNSFEGPGMALTFHLALTDFTSGGGLALPAFALQPEARKMPISETAPAFFSGDFPTPTRLAEADAQVRRENAAWFSTHPNAVAAALEHRMGRPGGNVIDSWKLTWTDGPSAGLTATVTARRLPVGPPVLTVESAETRHALPVSTARPSAETLANLSMAQYQSFEYLRCDFSLQDVCFLGPHALLGVAYTDDGPAGLSGEAPYAGLVVWMSRGLLLQENSLQPLP